MPTLSEFDPLDAVTLWINAKDRHKRSHDKAIQQEWFNGVFPQKNESITKDDISFNSKEHNF